MPRGEAALAAAPAPMRRHSRSGCHSACQPPEDRSSSTAMEPNSTRAIGGSCRAAVATSVENTGLCFCGMAEDTPRPGACSSVTSPISVRVSTRTSAASLPSAPVVTIRLAATSARGVRTPCQGRAGSASPRRRATNAGRRSVAPTGSAVSSAYWWYAASVPAAPPSETGSAARVRRTRSTASSTRCSQVAAFSPKVTGTACWVRVRPAIGVSRCRSACPARLSAHDSRSFAMRSSVAAHSNISAVSRMSWLVLPRCTYSAADASTDRTAAVSCSTNATTGLAVSRTPAATTARSMRAGTAAALMAVAAPAGITPNSACASARATSVASMAVSNALSSTRSAAPVAAHAGARIP